MIPVYPSPPRSVQAGHGLQSKPGTSFTFSGIAVPVLHGFNGFRSFVEQSKKVKAVADLPFSFANLLESDMIFGQDVGQIDELSCPTDFSIGSHVAHEDIVAIFHSRQFGRIRSERSAIDFTRCRSIQSFVRSLEVVFVSEVIETALLHIALPVL